MKLLVLSDLHSEFARFAPDPQATAGTDVVVLAATSTRGNSGSTGPRARSQANR